MKTLRAILLTLIITLPSMGMCQYRVSGKVSIQKNGKKKILGRDTRYGSFQSKVGNSTNSPLLNPDNNIIISFHPQGFTPTLAATQNAYITQVNQRFIPQVLPVVVGSVVYFLNEDNEYHNVYSRTPRSAFNIGRRSPGNTYPQKIQKTGVINISCDIHSHMNAVVLSLDTPYFTRVKPDGTYSITGLPAGKYSARLFHKFLGTMSREVEVRANTAQLNFALSEN
ncbi:MAG: carboxypeptidase regulatory-like domain-containing protein [Bacteroidota bacterium]